MSKNERILALRKSGMKPAEISHKLGVSMGKILNVCRTEAIRNGTFKKPAVTPAPVAGPIRGLMSKAAFLKPFDVTQQLRDTIPQLGSGIISDDDLRRHLKIGIDRWRVLRGMKEFLKYQRQIVGRRIWGQPAALAEVESKINLTDPVEA